MASKEYFSCSYWGLPMLIMSILFCYIVICKFKQNESQRYNDKGGAKASLIKVYLQGAEDRTETAIYWPPLLWPSALCLSCSPGCSTGGPEAQSLLDDGFLYCILASTSLDPNTSGAPRAPSVGLSLPHLISNFSGTQLNRGPRGPLRPGVAFPSTSRQ